MLFVFRYKLKANDAILASDDQKGLNETLLRDYPNHQFVAGGATQNSMRAATVINHHKPLPKSKELLL